MYKAATKLRAHHRCAQIETNARNPLFSLKLYTDAGPAHLLMQMSSGRDLCPKCNTMKCKDSVPMRKVLSREYRPAVRLEAVAVLVFVHMALVLSEQHSCR